MNKWWHCGIILVFMVLMAMHTVACQDAQVEDDSPRLVDVETLDVPTSPATNSPTNIFPTNTLTVTPLNEATRMLLESKQSTAVALGRPRKTLAPPIGFSFETNTPPPTFTPSITYTSTPSSTATARPTRTLTRTPTATFTTTRTPTPTETISPTPVILRTALPHETSPECDYQWFFAPVPTECPTSEAQRVDLVVQPFEHGLMIWVRDRPQVWMLYVDNYLPAWSTNFMPNTANNQQLLSTPPPNGLSYPDQIFRTLWSNGINLRERLGWATSEVNEYTGRLQVAGDNTTYVEYINNGTVQGVYVLYTGGTDWAYWESQKTPD